MSGPNPITIEAMDAFIRRTGLRLDPRDIELIEALDDLYLEKAAEDAAGEADYRQAIKDGLRSVSQEKRDYSSNGS